MSIRPENLSLYPPEWPKIREEILARANRCCEGSPAYPDCRAADREAHPVTGSKVVLTIAHLDHNPTNNDPSNLRAWCQKCHNTYDSRQRAANHKASKAILPPGMRNLAEGVTRLVESKGAKRLTRETLAALQQIGMDMVGVSNA